MAGARTDWGTLKFFASVGRLVIGVFALSVCLRSERNAFLEVGVIGLTVVAFLFAVQEFPLSSFGVGVWKELAAEAEAVVGPRAAGMAVVVQFVFVIILCKRYCLTLIGSTLICAAPTIIASDSKQVFLGIPLALSFLLVQKDIRLRTVAVLCPLVILVGTIIGYGFAVQHPRYITFQDDNRSYYERTTRSQDWDAGISTWRKSPLFGVGLGGYGKDSEHFGRAFPHNIGIEMLAETGLVGFVLGILFLMSCWATVLHRQRAWVRKDFMMILSIWAYCFAIAMVSQDIPANIEVLYFPAAAAAATSEDSLYS
jgi:O-antigen ligase